jgi:lysozyme
VIDRLTADLRQDEGEVLHAYQDHLGFWTIGVGILIDKRKGGGITKAESAYLLANRINEKREELARKAPWTQQLDEPRLCALLNMCFQMGVDGLLGFKNSLAYIKAGDYKSAVDNMRQSKWYTQTPERAERVIQQILTGEYRGA